MEHCLFISNVERSQESLFSRIVLNIHSEPLVQNHHYSVNKFIAYSCSYTVVSINMQFKGLVHPKINIVILMFVILMFQNCMIFFPLG